jgi:hypothetical protein
MTLTEISQHHPGWHAYQTRSGHVWAAAAHSFDPAGCGTTEDADTPEELDKKIAELERKALEDVA